MTKEQEIKQAFETVVIPLLPKDWDHGDDLNIYLDYEPGECGGWNILTGPIGRNNTEYLKIQKVFKPLLKAEWNRRYAGEDCPTSGRICFRYNQTTKKLFLSMIARVEVVTMRIDDQEYDG